MLLHNIANIGVILVALLHLWFLTLEMFLWQKPLGRKLFHSTPEYAKLSAPMAANQGLYNGFLSAGLLWSLLTSNSLEAFHLKLFFLTCIILAGIYGALSVSRRIFYFQALPAIITLIFLFLAQV